MRIAVSGSHCSGKSTLIEDFVASHPEYVHEPEPYEWLTELRGEQFGDELEARDFHRQLELSAERFRGFQPGERIIAERCPVDFLAYLLALGDLRRGGDAASLAAPAVELVARSLEHIDLLVVLPLNDADGIVAADEEGLELREAMNERLLDMVANDEFGMFGDGGTQVIELAGTPDRRLAALERAMEQARNQSA